jgi:hypothetical protein
MILESQENFRVEIEMPHADALKELQRITALCSSGSSVKAT